MSLPSGPTINQGCSVTTLTKRYSPVPRLPSESTITGSVGDLTAVMRELDALRLGLRALDGEREARRDGKVPLDSSLRGPLPLFGEIERVR